SENQQSEADALFEEARLIRSSLQRGTQRHAAPFGPSGTLELLVANRNSSRWDFKFGEPQSGTLPLREGQRFAIRASLSEPAYALIVAIQQGRLPVQIIYGEHSNDQKLFTTVRLGDTQTEIVFPLDEHGGPLVFVLLTSSRPFSNPEAVKSQFAA